MTISFHIRIRFVLNRQDISSTIREHYQFFVQLCDQLMLKKNYANIKTYLSNTYTLQNFFGNDVTVYQFFKPKTVKSFKYALPS